MATSTIKKTPLEIGSLTIKASVQANTYAKYIVQGDIMQVFFRVQAPSSGWSNNTILFEMPYANNQAFSYEMAVSSDQYYTQNKSHVFSYCQTNNKNFYIGPVSGNYWVQGEFTTFINR